MITVWYSETAAHKYGSLIYRLPDGTTIETTGIIDESDPNIIDELEHKWSDSKKVMVCSDLEMLEFVKVGKIPDWVYK